MKACFQTLRQNARRRHKPFKLTFAEFERLCRETKYMAGKGRTKKSFSIDCIQNDKGYVAGNIRVITISANSIKGTKTLVYDYRTGYAKVV